MRVEAPLGNTVVVESCDGGIKLGRCDDPIADRATPALGIFGLDPDHVSNHGCHLARIRVPLHSPDRRELCAPRMVQSRKFFSRDSRRYQIRPRALKIWFNLLDTASVAAERRDFCIFSTRFCTGLWKSLARNFGFRKKTAVSGLFAEFACRAAVQKILLTAPTAKTAA